MDLEGARMASLQCRCMFSSAARGTSCRCMHIPLGRSAAGRVHYLVRLRFDTSPPRIMSRNYLQMV